MKIEITKTAKSRKSEIDEEKLGFGQFFSDHMFLSRYHNGAWQSPRIVPYGAVELMPSTCALHYGQAVFEGLKAFWTTGNGINLFRPEKYHSRFNRSCDRLCIPHVDYDLFIDALRNLIAIDSDWVPRRRGYSLYIRPFIFATDNFLGVHVSDTYLFMIITSPVGAYYKEGLDPVKLITSGDYARAVKGGLGEAKTPANYASSLLPALEAQRKGFTQVLWLDAIEKRYIEEVGTMNIMFVMRGEVVTPPLEGSILGGITRDSVIQLARKWGITVRERRVPIDEVMEEAKRGNVEEVFGTGTAAVISPVGWIQHEDRTVTLNRGKAGELSRRFYDEITGVQYGEIPDRYGWTYQLTCDVTSPKSDVRSPI